MESLIESETNLVKSNELINTKRNYSEYEVIMAIYKKALDSTMQKFISLQKILNEYYDGEVITNVTGRIKSPESITGKMKKKKLELNYENMIENINDIAGIRIVCNFKDDIYKIRNLIKKQTQMKVIKEKDYLKKAKKSGYSAYHMIVEVPVTIKEETTYIKVEIQLRTTLMDFWSETEHKVKYKPSKKISNIDSMKLSIYAKIVNMISDKMMKINRK